MKICTKIEKNHYVDSLETLFTSAVLNNQKGIEIGYVNMAHRQFKEILAAEAMLTDEIEQLTGADFAIVARCESDEAFKEALCAIENELSQDNGQTFSFTSVADAVKAVPGANLCSIAVPGEYALEEVTKALNAGLHCVVLSNNVPLEDEREMKNLALKKGLLCMGPDCGVANINGAALVLASINNRGPFGICGASGTGIQHVAAILHECGSGVSQTIGTGGNDLKEPVGGIMMQMGIDVLEEDPKTKYIILISRKPADSVLRILLQKIQACTKPVVVFFMGCDKKTIEENGGIFAANLDDCADKALRLIGKRYSVESDDEIRQIAKKAVIGMSPTQKYIRGMYTGGTYMDEAMRAMEPVIGPIWSNAPLNQEYKLKNSYVSFEHSCIDYGEEEFTLGRPHPAIDPSVRKAEILKEASDKEVAVILLDFILTPPGHQDPVGYILPEIEKANTLATDGGRKLVFIGTILGTDYDFQNKNVQNSKLNEAGVIVCKSNNTASRLAAAIVDQLSEVKTI